MPNWCSNTLEIKGKRKDLVKIKEKLSGSNDCFTCENIIPRPENEDTSDLLAWSEVWGSKWEPDEPTVNDLEQREQSVDFIKDDDFLEQMDILTYCYNTAWSPISKVVEKLSELFPDCYFIEEYEEGGNGFHGV